MQCAAFRCFHANFHNTSSALVQMHVYFVYRQVKTSDRSSVTWVHPGVCICQFDINARNVRDAHGSRRTVVCGVAHVPTWAGQRRDVWCRWTQAVYGSYALPRVVHRRICVIAQVQTRCPTFRVQCWRSDFLFQSVTCWRMRRVLSAKHQLG